MPTTFYSHGKLLITGEYAVLDGAISLALPTKLGQSMEVSKHPEAHLLKWKSLDFQNKPWFETIISIDSKSRKLNPAGLSKTLNQKYTNTLLSVLDAAVELNPDFIYALGGKKVTTKLEFPNDWGLGSSSTFINNVAQWSEVNSFKLLWKGFTGSGYDIACAKHDTAILYSVENQNPRITKVEFNPVFKDHLFFVYLNKKQNSREGIRRYRQQSFDKMLLKSRIDKLTNAIFKTIDLKEFERLIVLHEQIIGEVLGMKPVKDHLFQDYNGAVKSLGAWGGDFVLATGSKEYVLKYFKTKGYQTILPYDDIIL